MRGYRLFATTQPKVDLHGSTHRFASSGLAVKSSAMRGGGFGALCAFSLPRSPLAPAAGVAAPYHARRRNFGRAHSMTWSVAPSSRTASRTLSAGDSPADGPAEPKTRKNPKIRVIIIMAFVGHFMVILGLNNIFKLLIGFSLRISLIKSRFHYFRGPELKIS